MKLNVQGLAALAAASTLVLAAAANATPLVSFDFDGSSSNETTFPSKSTAPGVNATSITDGAGFGGIGYLGNSFSAYANNGEPATLADAVNGNNYFSIPVSPTSGNQLTVTDLTGLFFYRNMGGLATLEDSATGFGAGAANNLDTQSVTADSSKPDTLTFTLPTAVNIPAGGQVEFRLYFYGSSGQYNERGFGALTPGDGVTDLAVDGSVSSVPEPAAMSLIGAGALALLARRRRA